MVVREYMTRLGTGTMLYNSVKLISLNVNGLNNVIKRSKDFFKLKKRCSSTVFTGHKAEEHEKLKQLGCRKTFYSSYKPKHNRGWQYSYQILNNLKAIKK